MLVLQAQMFATVVPYSMLSPFSVLLPCLPGLSQDARRSSVVLPMVVWVVSVVVFCSFVLATTHVSIPSLSPSVALLVSIPRYLVERQLVATFRNSPFCYWRDCGCPHRVTLPAPPPHRIDRGLLKCIRQFGNVGIGRCSLTSSACYHDVAPL